MCVVGTYVTYVTVGIIYEYVILVVLVKVRRNITANFMLNEV